MTGWAPELPGNLAKDLRASCLPKDNAMSPERSYYFLVPFSQSAFALSQLCIQVLKAFSQL